MSVIQFQAVSPARDWAHLLSPREAEVLRLIAAGRTNAEIAGELFIAVPTVKTHVARLLTKVRTRDRVGLVVAAYRSGFVSVDPGTGARRRCAERHRAHRRER